MVSFQSKDIAGAIYWAWRLGKKVLVFGCGGSMSTAEHFVSELVNYPATGMMGPAFVLNTPTVLTQLFNDYHSNEVFSRWVQACAAPGDVVIGITTSGNSPSILNGLEQAHRIGAYTIALTGPGIAHRGDAPHAAYFSDNDDTASIQADHLDLAHDVAEDLSEMLKNDGGNDGGAQ